MKRIIFCIVCIMFCTIIYSAPGKKRNIIIHTKDGAYVDTDNPLPVQDPDFETNTLGARQSGTWVVDTKGTTVTNFTEIRGNTFNVYIKDANDEQLWLDNHIGEITGNGETTVITTKEDELAQREGSVFEVFYEASLGDGESTIIELYVPTDYVMHIDFGGQGKTGGWKITPYWGCTTAPGGITLTPHDTNGVTDNTSNIKWYYDAITLTAGTQAKPLYGGTVGLGPSKGTSGDANSEKYIVGEGTYFITVESFAASNIVTFSARYMEHN